MCAVFYSSASLKFEAKVTSQNAFKLKVNGGKENYKGENKGIARIYVAFN